MNFFPIRMVLIYAEISIGVRLRQDEGRLPESSFFFLSKSILRRHS